MDLVLDIFDEHLLDSVWASITPMKLPLDGLAGTENARSLGKQALLQTTSSIAAAATGAAGSFTSESPYEPASQDGQQWITVSAWPRDDWRRQFVSLCALTMIGIHLMYFTLAGFSYYFLFDHRLMKHPRFLKNQISMEIKTSLIAFPWLTLMTVPWFVGDCQGLSKMYDHVEDGPWGGGIWGYAFIAFTCAAFFLFTDFGIYFVHRYEHHPLVYKHLHKLHHKWIIPTPWASHAFNPMDGYLQSLPYHIYAFMFPMHKLTFLILFGVINLWTIAIHDSDMIHDHPLEKVINGPAHHTLHHMYFTVNYGQYFTYMDRQGGSYRQPKGSDDPLLTVLAKEEKEKGQQQSEEARQQELETELALSKAEQQQQQNTEPAPAPAPSPALSSTSDSSAFSNFSSLSASSSSTSIASAAADVKKSQ